MTIQTKEAFIELAGRLWDEAFPQQPEQPKPEQKVIYSFELPNSPNNGFEASMEILTLAISAIDMSKIPVGSVLELPDGGKRTVTSVGPAYGNSKAMIKFTGGMVVGKPGTVKVLAGEGVAAPKPEGVSESIVAPAPEPIKDERKLDFDLYLMGVNLAGAEFNRGVLPGTAPTNYRRNTRETFQRAAGHGLKTIRLPFAWERLQPTLDGPLDKSFLAWMHNCFAWAKEFDQRIILDMHQYFRRNVNGKDVLIGSASAPLQHFLDIWKLIAKEFMGYPNLLGYEPMNEPYKTNGTWGPAAQKVVDAIREVDADTLIFVNGDFYASAQYWIKDPDGVLTNSTFPLKGKRIVYTAHGYHDPNGSGRDADPAAAVAANVGVNRFRVFVEWCKKHGVMGAVTETGIDYRQNQTAYKALEATLEYLIGNDILVTYYAAGDGWTPTSDNALEIKENGKYFYLPPIDIIKKFTNRKTRVIGPIA